MDLILKWMPDGCTQPQLEESHKDDEGGGPNHRGSEPTIGDTSQDVFNGQEQKNMHARLRK